MQTTQTFCTPEATFDFIGREVLDEHGMVVGDVVDVVCDDAGCVEYLVVDPGRLRAARYVPAAKAYHTNGHQVVVAWERSWIMKGPKATGNHRPDADRRVELDRHYTDG
ncbi:MAG TPA: PRC-barrel domain-containing protein [Ilumatobacter sp.]